MATTVASDPLVEANGRLEASRSVAGILGPGLSGALVQLLTAPLAILVDAASFFVSAIFMLGIRAPEAKISRRNAGMWREIGEGVRLVFGHRLLRLMLLTTVIFNLFTGILNAQFVLYATRDLHITPLAIGGMGVVSSVCGLLAASLAGWIGAHVGIGRTMTIATFLIAAGWLVLPLVQGTPDVAALLVAGGACVAAIGDGLYNVNSATLRQLVTPHALQGRVSASMRVFIWGAQPIGALAGGALGITIGLRYTLLITACGYFLGFLSSFFSPMRNLRTIAPLDEPAQATTP
jgi:hypothetical protein